jgi:hypothetical protein
MAAALAGCGGARCGDGHLDPGEQCDEGAQNGQPGVACSASCQKISVPVVQLEVQWSPLLSHTGVDGFGGAHCEDVGAVFAHVVVTGPTRIDEMIPCVGIASRTFAADCPEADGGMGMVSCGQHLAEGSYQATVTLVRADGSAVTRAVSGDMVAAIAGPVTQLPVDFEMADFLQSYTGSLELRLSWGADGNSCSQATPPVVMEALRLSRMGMAVTGKHAIASDGTVGNALDGTPGTCYVPTTTRFTEEAKDLDWGPYQLTIEGFAAGTATAAYCATQAIFIGPGTNNQIWTLTVPSVAQGGPDAGCF